MRARSVIVVAALALAPFALGGACAAEANLVERGGECFLASDCAPGLICVEQANKSRICTDDLSRVGGDPPAGQDAAQMDGPAAEAATDAPTPPVDARPDTNNPADTGADTNQPPEDAATD